jgi:signal transduction histidine kinase
VTATAAVPAGVPARRWDLLFIGARAGAAFVAAGLLSLRPVENADPTPAVTALVWGGITIAAVRLWPRLMGRAAAWSVDLAVALALVVASGDWRSPFYLLAVSALIAPATTLSSVAAIALGAGFACVYFALALTLGIEWSALASTARLESFSTHLLIPILVAVALAQATTLLARLDSERERAEALALEAERRRIAWELHDSAKQRIHAAHLVLSSLTPALGPSERERLRLALAELDGSAADIEESLGELRTTLEVRDGALLPAVADDGRGLAAASEDSTGLESMRARAELLGGKLRIRGERRAGTSVELEIPLRGAP